jgi:hypothetical protein
LTISTQSRLDLARLTPQPKNLNRRKQRKQRVENFAENAEFSQIALQGRKEETA